MHTHTNMYMYCDKMKLFFSYCGSQPKIFQSHSSRRQEMVMSVQVLQEGDTKIELNMQKLYCRNNCEGRTKERRRQKEPSDCDVVLTPERGEDRKAD